MARRAPEPLAEAAPPVRKGITRRQALAAAVATGVGVGAVRLLGGTIQNLSHSGAASGTDWVSPLGRESARAMQLLRRTSFGYTQAQLDAALSDGYSKTVDRLLETKPAEPPVLAAALTPGGRFGVPELQQWWVGHMLTSPTPFAERMTLFWHGHFTSDYRKTANNTFMYWQNLTWRRMGMTNLRSMLMDVTTDPAMLRHLNRPEPERELLEGAYGALHDGCREFHRRRRAVERQGPGRLAATTARLDRDGHYRQGQDGHPEAAGLQHPAVGDLQRETRIQGDGHVPRSHRSPRHSGRP